MLIKMHTLGTRTLCPSETDVRLVMALLKKEEGIEGNNCGV